MHRIVAFRPQTPLLRLAKMSSQLSNGASIGPMNGHGEGVSLADLPKSNVFTTNLPADPVFPKPVDSFKAPRQKLGPRMVKGALYTYIRPEEKDDAELVGVSLQAMQDIGLKSGVEETEDFKQLVAGNKIMWDHEKEEGIYPWAQCYGGWQFGQWAGQLGDGRAISLFESINPTTKRRYEIQLKGAGKTPYSRFADGRAVVRSSVREFVVSEALNGLKIPTTRALALTLTPQTRVQRERIEPGAIVCRFAQSWLRIGTFDILRARGDRANIRRLSDYIAENVFDGWNSLPSTPFPDATDHDDTSDETPKTRASELHLNRYTALYREICIRNARTVAAWQAYGFTNGVLNTDNTSLFGLSLDFGPFAFIDNFDPSFTPNHDDHMLRYSYRNQPSIIWWNLVRLGESMGELLGAGPSVDDTSFISEGVSDDFAPELIARAEGIIEAVGGEYQREFLIEYKRLMTARLGLKTTKDNDFKTLFSELLDTLEALELDFSHFFRRLSNIPLADLETSNQRKLKAAVFFHAEGVPGGEGEARERIAKWLDAYRARAIEDWGSASDSELSAQADDQRRKAMLAVNPNFVPRGWVLDELIRRVEKEGDREVLGRVMKMVADPFAESWGGDKAEEERWCGEVPRTGRGIMCSCSS